MKRILFLLTLIALLSVVGLMAFAADLAPPAITATTAAIASTETEMTLTTFFDETSAAISPATSRGAPTAPASAATYIISVTFGPDYAPTMATSAIPERTGSAVSYVFAQTSKRGLVYC